MVLLRKRLLTTSSSITEFNLWMGLLQIVIFMYKLYNVIIVMFYPFRPSGANSNHNFYGFSLFICWLN